MLPCPTPMLVLWPRRTWFGFCKIVVGAGQGGSVRMILPSRASHPCTVTHRSSLVSILASNLGRNGCHEVAMSGIRASRHSRSPIHRQSRSWTARLLPELDHVTAGERDLVGDDGRPTLVHVPSSILFHVGVFGRHTVDRHDNLVAALRCPAAGADDRTLGGRAGHDHRLDAMSLKPLFQRRAQELVRSTLDNPFALMRRDTGVDNISGCRIRTADQC